MKPLVILSVVVALVLGVHLGCQKDDANLAGSGSGSVNVTGDWSLYAKSSRSTSEYGPMHMTLTQTGNTLSGTISGSALIGTLSGRNVTLAVLDSANHIWASLVGTLSSDTMAGSYTTAELDTGTWRARKGVPVYGSTYHVYGGSTHISDTAGFHPERHGYSQLGFGTSTATYYGAFRYYIIVTYPWNTVRVDAVQGSTGQYFATYTTGNTPDYQKISGPPDGQYALVGGLYPDVGGYVLIDASGVDLTSIKVFIVPK